MAVVLYQRAEPRQKQWLPLLSQQIRLRNVTGVVVVKGGEGPAYYTLHTSPLSAPFYTSPRGRPEGGAGGWPDLHLPPVRLSAPGLILRLWTDGGQPVFSWGLRFGGLHPLGHNPPPADLPPNTLLLLTPYGAFTPAPTHRFLSIRTTVERDSYSLKALVALHRIQRSLLEEVQLAEKMKEEIGLYGYGGGGQGQVLSDRLLHRLRAGQAKLRVKEEIEGLKANLSFLVGEKGRAEGRVARLKKDAGHLQALTADLAKLIHNFECERVNVKEWKAQVASKAHLLSQLRSRVFVRKKQLISELLLIYPLCLIEGSKRYSINGVQLPNAEEYGNEGGGQISVALGYTAHLVAMLCFFLDIPCRYSIRHFGSRSRIIDHITVQIPDKEREFPLYFKGKRDVYSAYAVYLLNKNVGQLRWYCALSTPDLRATLPNLVQLISNRLVIPGWPPSLVDSLEIAQEITEVDVQFSETDSTSLDNGLDKIMDSDGVSKGERYLRDRRDSFSENPGGNSTALGEIQHGRGQERFLSGWKKKTYVETDDFDPKWLLDSMNLDFDTGRRFSICQPSPPSRPSVLIEDVRTRQRRMGQVEPPPIFNQPSRDIATLEVQIKELERRRSRIALPTDSPTDPTTFQQSTNHYIHSPTMSDSESNLGVDRMSDICDSGYHIPPPLQEDVQSLSGQEVDAIPTREMKVPEVPSEKLVVSNKEESLESLGVCDNEHSQDRGDSALWIRTEALLGAPSFNLVRRRMSEST